MDDSINGAQLLLEEFDEELQNRRLTKKDRLLLRSSQYILKGMISMRQDISTLKSHDVIGWAKRNPRGAWLFGIGLLTVNSMVNWSGIRKPLLQSVIHFATGIVIPLDVLP